MAPHVKVQLMRCVHTRTGGTDFVPHRFSQIFGLRAWNSIAHAVCENIDLIDPNVRPPVQVKVRTSPHQRFEVQDATKETVLVQII